MCVGGGGGGWGIKKEWGSKSFVGRDIYFSCCSGSFSPVKISGFKHSFKYLSPYALLKTHCYNW